MGELTLLEKLERFLMKPYYSIEYYFAKKWLDRNFGEREFWGSDIMELLSNNKEVK